MSTPYLQQAKVTIATFIFDYKYYWRLYHIALGLKWAVNSPDEQLSKQIIAKAKYLEQSSRASLHSETSYIELGKKPKVLKKDDLPKYST